MEKQDTGKYDEFVKKVSEELKSGKPISGKGGVFTPFIKQVLEGALEEEIETHMKREIEECEDIGMRNRRNGKSRKQIRTDVGSFELETPRDRNSSFEPAIVKKRQRYFGNSLDKKIISLYALGMSYSDISEHLKELYDVEVSVGLIANITDKILPYIKEWQTRQLEAVYPFVWLDAIHYKVKEEGRIISKAVYTILGLNCKGHKQLLGLYISPEKEGSHFWLQVLTDLSNRGVKDILIACIDNLKGFAEAIESIYPKTEVQLCVIHQIRNSVKYVSHKDRKDLMEDLKKVYKATTKESAEEFLKLFENKWHKKYPVVVKSWKQNWDRLSQYFKYPEHIRRIMYTTNIIEGYHRQLRKVTKSKGAFTSDIALLKLLYLVTQNIASAWMMPTPNWSLTLNQLNIFFSDRLSLDLNIYN
jgi:transposase-like protein